jgi:hypothetical protein
LGTCGDECGEGDGGECEGSDEVRHGALQTIQY